MGMESRRGRSAGGGASSREWPTAATAVLPRTLGHAHTIPGIPSLPAAPRSPVEDGTVQALLPLRSGIVLGVVLLLRDFGVGAREHAAPEVWAGEGGRGVSLTRDVK